VFARAAGRAVLVRAAVRGADRAADRAGARRVAVGFAFTGMPSTAVSAKVSVKVVIFMCSSPVFARFRALTPIRDALGKRRSKTF
jgi:hypothetical protein